MSKQTLLAVGVILVAGLWGCGNSANPSDQQVLRRGLGGEPSALDPAAAGDNFSVQVLQDLYEGLTIESPTGDVLPGVASSWTIDPTGKRYTFQIRANAHWSNGKPVRAQDFVAAWRRVLDPKLASPVSDNLRVLAGATEIIAGHSPPSSLGVSASNDNLLVVNLERPAPYLLQLLTHPSAFPIYSDASAQSHDPTTWVSNGAYVLANWQPGTVLDLVRNTNYWDQANVHIAKVIYQIAPDDNAQYARYRAGQLDVTDSVPTSAIDALRAQHSSELVISPFLGTAYYGLNLSEPHIASNLNLRKALAMAIDRKRLVRALAFGQAGAYGFVPPGTWNYEPQTWEWKDQSDDTRLTAARELYAQAGYSPKAPLRMRLLFNSNVVIKNTAILVAAMWKETLGIETELTEEEYRVFLQSRHDKKRWEIVRLGWTADFNDASNFLDIFRTRSPNNDEDYSNPSFDQHLEDAASTPESMRRKSLLEASERTMLADYPIIPLYFYVSKWLVKPYVHGVHPNPLNRLPSKALTIASH